MDTQNIYGKLPGFGGSHEAVRQQNFVDRSLGKGSPGKYSNKADVVIDQGVKRQINTDSRSALSVDNQNKYGGSPARAQYPGEPAAGQHY